MRNFPRMVAAHVLIGFKSGTSMDMELHQRRIP